VAYIYKCSKTVRPSKIASNCGQYPIYFLALLNPSEVVISFPLIVNYPYDGYISPVKHLNNVVLPAPDIPNKAKHSPYSNPKEIFLTAVKSPKCFLTLEILTGKY
jgi:hypothetical protein